MNKVYLNEPSIKTVVYANYDVHIVILLTLDKETDGLKIWYKEHLQLLKIIIIILPSPST